MDERRSYINLNPLYLVPGRSRARVEHLFPAPDSHRYRAFVNSRLGRFYLREKFNSLCTGPAANPFQRKFTRAPERGAIAAAAAAAAERTGGGGTDSRSARRETDSRRMRIPARGGRRKPMHARGIRKRTDGYDPGESRILLNIARALNFLPIKPPASLPVLSSSFHHVHPTRLPDLQPLLPRTPCQPAESYPESSFPVSKPDRL